MASENELTSIRESYRLRWVELTKQVAVHGVDTGPEVLIEIESISRQWGFVLPPPVTPIVVRPDGTPHDQDWLRLLAVAALKTVVDVRDGTVATAGELRARQRVIAVIHAALLLLNLIILFEIMNLAHRLGGW